MDVVDVLGGESSIIGRAVIVDVVVGSEELLVS